MKRYTKKDNFRAIFRKFCSQSTITSLKYFYLYPDFFSRCYWTLNIVLVLLLAGLLTWLLYNRFNEIPTRIAIENQYAPLHDLPYPTITICSPNQITRSGVMHLNKTLIDGDSMISLEEIVPKLLGFYRSTKNVNSSGLTELQRILENNRYNTPDVIGSLPQKCDDYLELCYLHRQKYPKCHGLFRPVMTLIGICCSFNSFYEFKEKRNVRIKNFIPQMIGESQFLEGLTVVVDSNPGNSMPNTLLSAGANLVFYTDWTEFPIGFESILVEPGTEAYHLIRATYTYCSDEVKALPSWSRQCYFEDEQVLPHFKGYRNTDCLLTCFLKAIEKECHCLMFIVPNLHLSDACTVTKIPCVVGVNKQMSKWIDQCDCPRNCEERQYKVDASIGNLNALQHIPNNPFAEITFNRSTSIMRFIFPKSVYVIQKQEAVMPLIMLVCKYKPTVTNLGGVFGLCLGCSFISILEILFFTYLYIKRCIYRRLANRISTT